VLKQNKKNYRKIDKELMGMVTGIDNYSDFIRSKKKAVKVLTDNGNPTDWSKFTLSRHRHLRQFEILTSFNFRPHHVKGALTYIADSFSRPFNSDLDVLENAGSRNYLETIINKNVSIINKVV
jgi:hypothetical protein